MEATLRPEGVVTLSMTVAEAVIVHVLIAHAEFAEDLEVIELVEPVSKKVMSDVQQALAPCIPTLGTGAYGTTIERAYAEIDPRPFSAN